MKELLKNDSKKLRVINVWATWCGPCIAEFSELVETYRMFMGRDFEMFTISTDKLINWKKKEKVKEFLQNKDAALTNNFLTICLEELIKARHWLLQRAIFS